MGGGRQRFKLSDMIPNAWFYKLKDMSSSKSGGGAAAGAGSRPMNRGIPPPPPVTPRQPYRASYYYSPKALDTHFPPLHLDPPRKSRRRRHHRREADHHYCRDHPPHRDDTRLDVLDHDGGFPLLTASATDIVLDIVSKPRKQVVPPELDLAPILTKPPPLIRKRADHHQEPEDKHVVDSCSTAKTKTQPPRRSASSAGHGRRLRTRAVTPRIAVKNSAGRKSAASKKQLDALSQSFVVVKSSSDARRDFRESMEEMIVENGIRSAAGLEDLLACYLALNAPEYHDVIVDVFEHIWLELRHLRLLKEDDDHHLHHHRR